MSATPDAHVPELALFDPTSPLRATGNLGRRGAVSRAVEVICIAGAAVAVAFMAEVVWTVIHRGASVLSFGFVTQNPTGLVGGGIVNSILGTFVVVALGAVIAIPLGVLTALYLT